MSKKPSANFFKYEGAGNDFILIDDRLLSFTSDVKTLCDRKFGIGADGLILLQPSPTAHFRMRIFNSDGSEAESCGNGLRCLGQFILDLGFKRQPYSIELMHKTVEISYTGDLIEVDMGEPINLVFNQQIDQHTVHSVNTGVPHAVLFVEDIVNAPVETLGPYLRHHKAFQPKGTNVNFAAMQNDGSIRIRTYERGVEGETLACGTGACAVVLIANELYGLRDPTVIRCKTTDLQISSANNRLTMRGPARRVFMGVFFITSLER